MDLKDILKGSRFEKYTEDFHNKGVFTVEEYYKSINSGISDVITDEKERIFFSFFMTEKTIIEPNHD